MGQYSCQGQSHKNMLPDGLFPDNSESQIHESHFKNGNESDTPAYTALNRNQDEILTQKYQRKRKDFNQNHFKSGRHESWEYYDACFRRTRNNGLFVADRTRAQNLGATRTRQNENGQRRGFECPEERDFYPYWHPTPWTDIAVLTSQPHNCEFYKNESMLPKYECVEYYDKTNRQVRKHFSKANHEKECTRIGGDWTGFYNFQEIIPEVSSKSACSEEAEKIGKDFGSQVVWAIPYFDGEGRHLPPTERCLVLPPAVDCATAPWSRANHLGNSQSGNMARYKWTLPHFHFDKSDQECILRVRYNISSDDYPEIFDSGQISTYHENEHFRIELTFLSYHQGHLLSVIVNFTISMYVDVEETLCKLFLRLNTILFLMNWPCQKTIVFIFNGKVQTLSLEIKLVRDEIRLTEIIWLQWADQIGTS